METKLLKIFQKKRFLCKYLKNKKTINFHKNNNNNKKRRRKKKKKFKKNYKK